MKDYTENNNPSAEGACGGNHGGGLKKKDNRYRKSKLKTAGEFFKGVVLPHRPKLYLMTMEQLGLYTRIWPTSI